MTRFAVNGQPPLPYQIDHRPAQEFSYDGAKSKLINLVSSFCGSEDVKFLVPGESMDTDDDLDHDDFGSTSRQGNFLKLSSWIDLDNLVSIGCVGAVLTYLQRKRSSEYLQDDPNAQQAYRITSLEMFSLKGTLWV